MPSYPDCCGIGQGSSYMEVIEKIRTYHDMVQLMLQLFSNASRIAHIVEVPQNL